MTSAAPPAGNGATNVTARSGNSATQLALSSRAAIQARIRVFKESPDGPELGARYVVVIDPDDRSGRNDRKPAQYAQIYQN